jgi:hypothetical protein
MSYQPDEGLLRCPNCQRLQNDPDMYALGVYREIWDHLPLDMKASTIQAMRCWAPHLFQVLKRELEKREVWKDFERELKERAAK